MKTIYPTLTSILLLTTMASVSVVAGATASSGPLPVSVQTGQTVTNSLGMKFVPVPGTPTLFCIWLTRTQDFDAFAKAANYDATPYMWSLRGDGVKARGDTWKNPGFAQQPMHPVVGVSWKDAKAFCQWLTEKERGEGRLRPVQSYRLPTAAEWRIAAGKCEKLGGSPVSDKEAKVVESPSDWLIISGHCADKPKTSPVESSRTNQYSLCDISSNAFQWCEDRYDDKTRASGRQSWFRIGPGWLLSSSCNISPDIRVGLSGFRVVLATGAPPHDNKPK